MADLLQLKLPDKDNLAIRLQKNCAKLVAMYFAFLHYNNVPPGNNGSERAIRNIKIKQKISGGFRSASGAGGFVILRPAIDTTIKSGNHIFHALSLIAKLAAE